MTTRTSRLSSYSCFARHRDVKCEPAERSVASIRPDFPSVLHPKSHTTFACCSAVQPREPQENENQKSVGEEEPTTTSLTTIQRCDFLRTLTMTTTMIQRSTLWLRIETPRSMEWGRQERPVPAPSKRIRGSSSALSSSSSSSSSSSFAALQRSYLGVHGT